MASAVITQLIAIWKSNISFPVKIKLYKSLILSILLYGCESWTLTANTEHRIQAFKNKCYRILNIFFLLHKTNTFIRDKVVKYAGNQEHLITVVKHCKLAWFGHVNRHDSLSKTILQGTVQGARRQGGQRKNWWSDNIKQWTKCSIPNLKNITENREQWRALCKISSSILRPLRLTPGVMSL
jgi:hypothetical protein